MKNLITLSLILLIFCSCRKDKNEVNPSISTNLLDTTIIGYTPEVAIVTGSVIGFVISENGNPVVNAEVALNNNFVNTDERGQFIIQDVNMNSKGTFVQVKKSGYFPGSNRFFPKDGSVNQVRIILLDETNIGSFSGADGGMVSSSENISLEFPTNSIFNTNGELHTGEVQVAARFIDPTDKNIYEIMPGDLQGVNSNSEEVILSSYGMMAVELEDNSGQPLNLGNGKKATLSFPVPDELLSSANATIPLWYFNDNFGVWVQEGEATLEGGKYVGEVAHFSFWNCDVPDTYIELSGMVLDDNGNPFDWASIRLEVVSTGDSRISYTDNTGIFSGKVPDNETFIMKITQYYGCDNNSLTTTIGPFSEDTDIGSFVFSTGASSIKHITGTVVDCNNNPVTQGFVKMDSPYTSTWTWPQYLALDGTFDYTLYDCDLYMDFTLLATDVGNLEIGNEQTYTINNADIDVGNVVACGNAITDALTITADGITTNFLSPSFQVNSDSTRLDAYISISGNWYSVSFRLNPITSTGTYNYDAIHYHNLYIPASTGTNLDMYCGDLFGGDLCDPTTTLEITEFGEIGEPVIGTFSGTGEFFDGTNAVTLPYFGTFNTIRQ